MSFLPSPGGPGPVSPRACPWRSQPRGSPCFPSPSFAGKPSVTSPPAPLLHSITVKSHLTCGNATNRSSLQHRVSSPKMFIACASGGKKLKRKQQKRPSLFIGIGAISAVWIGNVSELWVLTMGLFCWNCPVHGAG